MSHSESESIKGLVERVTYSCTEKGFCVLKVKVAGQRDLVTILGPGTHAGIGEQIEAFGTWKVSNTYGRQYVARQIVLRLPSALEGIKKYLASGLIRGIGPHYAKKIVETFGEDTFEVIDHTPALLKKIEGIGEARVESISKSWKEQKAVKEIMVFLQAHDISSTQAMRMYKLYGDAAVNKVKENPYILAKELRGIGFLTADSIALKLGTPFNSSFRLRAGIEHVLVNASKEGHTLLALETIIAEAIKLLAVPADVVANEISDACSAEQLTLSDIDCKPAVGLPFYLYYERMIAKKLRNMDGISMSTPLNFEQKIRDYGKKFGFTLDETQVAAIQSIMLNNVVVVTGGPGTGKTTLLKVATRLLADYGLWVSLAAPTGRAAKRMHESTGFEAKTIHRTIGIGMHSSQPEYNEEYPLTTDVLILDEASMVNVQLFYSLITALPDACKLIIIGDVDQLPPIGPGQVLKDIIDSGFVPCIKLTKVFRQAEHSSIVLNAHRINQGIEPRLDNQDDFWFIEQRENIEQAIVDLATTTLAGKFDVFKEIQILSPIQAGDTGVRNINAIMQKQLFPSPIRHISRFGQRFVLGDKVMQVVNNYDKDVYNGDIGQITAINLEDQVLIVDISNRAVKYDFDELDQLTLAYASTVHKAQGSEFPVIIIPMCSKNQFALRRQLLYTAVTRAKELVIIVGQRSALSAALRSNHDILRSTKLKSYLSLGVW